MWQKRFYLTDGAKFGSDFIAYPGDPVSFHAQYVIVCVDGEEAISLMSKANLVAKSRLGTAVNKGVILAYIKADQVRYKLLRWNGS